VALYGKIWRTQKWDWIKDPAQLLAKAREHLKTGVAVQTLTLKLVDMHFITGSADAITIGQYVRILSTPHGLDITLNCTKIDIDLLNPENTTYTFGEKPRTLTDNVVRTEDDVNSLTGKGGGSGGSGGTDVKKAVSDVVRWAKIQADEDKAKISLVAGEQYEDIKGDKSLKQAYIDIDGAKSKITLLAGQEYENIDGKKTISEAYLKIDAANTVIETKVSKDGVISSINQTPEAVTIDASKINLNGYVTASQLKTEFANFESGITDNLFVSALSATTFECGKFKFGQSDMSLKQAEFLTSGTTLTVETSGGTVTGVTLNKKTDKIYYMSWEG